MKRRKSAGLLEGSSTRPLHVRDYKCRVKAVGKADGLKEGQFRALVSTYGIDSYGDKIIPGAFADDIERWKAGEFLPVVWSHQWTDPFSHIGGALDATETDQGLEVLAEILDLDVNPTAQQVHRLLAGRRINQFSFAFDLVDAGWGKADGEDVFEIRKLKTHEVGPCLVGVNQETELIDAKAAELRSQVAAGRDLPLDVVERLSDTVDSLREVIEIAKGAQYDSAEGQAGDPSTDSTDDLPESGGKVDEKSTSARPRLAEVEALFIDAE